MTFKFATDCETGYLFGSSFSEACEQLRKMVPSEAIADGGWGWVDDANGTRYRINC